MRIGFGYDVHQLAENYPLWLGGIKIDFFKGSVGHSDADVLIHAIMDAMLGATNLRDIGFQYPDSSNTFKGIDSKKLLQDTYEKIDQKGYEIVNIDSTICLQQPKISPFIPEMKETIASVLKIDLDCVSIKATTTEHLGFVGKGEGIAAYAVVLLRKKYRP